MQDEVKTIFLEKRAFVKLKYNGHKKCYIDIRYGPRTPNIEKSPLLPKCRTCTKTLFVINKPLIDKCTVIVRTETFYSTILCLQTFPFLTSQNIWIINFHDKIATDHISHNSPDSHNTIPRTLINKLLNNEEALSNECFELINGNKNSILTPE